VDLVQWAESQDVHYHTAYRWFHDGVLPVPAERVGPRTILVGPHSTKLEPPAGVGLYARVSSHDQKNDLDRQVSRLSEWAAKGMHAHVTEQVLTVSTGLLSVETIGFEPTTSCVQSRRSSQLSYVPRVTG
jgi:predicted site-specific integrase-resolvase